MRKLFLFLFLTATSTSLFAQDFKDIQDAVEKKKYTEAKDKVDKALADAKNQKNANAWYYKGIVYNNLAKDSTNVQNSGELRTEAFNAFKKYQELDPKNVRGALEQNWWYFDMYNEYIKTALNQHNSKDYTRALQNYKNAFAVHDYIAEKKYTYNSQTLPELDTIYLYYAGSASLEAKDTATAIQYFEKIANANVPGKDYLFVYQTLVNYYNGKGDKANTEKYAGIGKKLYPDNQYWLYYELSDPAYKTDKAKLLSKYEEMISKNPGNKELKEDYALELYNYTYTNDKNAKDTVMQGKAKTALTDLINSNATGFYNYLMVQALQFEAGTYFDNVNTIKGTKPEDVKRKQALQAAAKRKDAEAMNYAAAAVELYGKQEKLKPQDQAYYKDVLNRLISYHRGLKQTDKVTLYEQKLKSF
ncbi:MAG TPA: hypothetical protein VM888_05625 [Chitinophagaceae bacterium]|jgi:hypothetical protein|nr:hypothetical protein [Chitinophagaceae bacterium]